MINDNVIVNSTMNLYQDNYCNNDNDEWIMIIM